MLVVKIVMTMTLKRRIETLINKEFIRDATQAGFSVDDLLRAETLLTENFHSPKFASVDRGGGHVRHPQPLASRITEAVADL